MVASEEIIEGGLELPGIDTERGLRLMAGNEKMYMILLRSYLDHHADDDVRILEAMACGREAEARRLVHTLVGLVGGFGATGLATASAELDRQMAGSDADALQLSLDRFMRQFQQVSAGLRGFFAETSPQKGPRNEKPLDLRWLSERLQQLLALLYADLAAAQGVFEEIDTALNGTALHEEGVTLRRLFDNFELDPMQKLLAELIDRLA